MQSSARHGTRVPGIVYVRLSVAVTEKIELRFAAYVRCDRVAVLQIQKEIHPPGLEPGISSSGERRRIHWAIGAWLTG